LIFPDARSMAERASLIVFALIASIALCVSSMAAMPYEMPLLCGFLTAEYYGERLLITIPRECEPRIP